MRKLRSRTIFHYDPSLIRKAIARRSGNDQSRRCRITYGDPIDLTRFEIADDVVDTMVCRGIWRIPEDADVSEEADRIAVYISDLGRAFAEFSGEFILNFLRFHRFTR